MEDVGRRRGPRRWWVLAALWAALIFALSSIPGHDIPGPDLPGLDKVVHFLEFGLLGLLLALSIRRGVPAFLVAVTWGVLDEFHQHFTPFRTVSVYDALADAIGAACGAALVLWLLARRAQKERREEEATHGDRT